MFIHIHKRILRIRTCDTKQIAICIGSSWHAFAFMWQTSKWFLQIVNGCNLNENINATIHPWRFPWAALTARYKSCNLRAVLWKPCFFSFLHYFLFPKIVMSFPCYISGWQLTLNYLKKLMSFYRLVDRILGVKEKIKSEITFSIFDSVAKSATSRQTSTST